MNGMNAEPFRVFISGGAGTGKSHLIKCIYQETCNIMQPHSPNPDDVVVLLTAPTATAAFNIGGTTLHQAFSLSKSLPIPYIYTRDDELNKLRSKLQNLQILIIDEISMVGQIPLLYVSERLRQIKQSGNALFGDVCVIAVGDFYQLPPVRQKCLYDPRQESFFPLWSNNFSLMELTQIMRQKDDAIFAQLFNRLRIKKKQEQLASTDLAILEACALQTVPPETLHIFGTNKEVSAHNLKMINLVCEATESLKAKDFDKHPQIGRLMAREGPYETSSEYLPPHLTLSPKARVMLIRNIDISCGLVNGAMGTVVELSSRDPESSVPRAVMVHFDNTKVGRIGDSTEHQAIKIIRYEEKLNNNAVRHQFPLQLAWACTTHKVQGSTTDKAVVSLKHIFAAGMAYVALSRVTSLAGLVIQDFDQDKIYCNEQISDALQRMPPFLAPKNVSNINEARCTVVLHNVQGLVTHIEDMRANSDLADVDIICMTETWLGKKSTCPSLDNFRLISKSRFSSYSSRNQLFKQLKNKKHGGVGIYVREEIECRQLSLDSVQMECIGLNIQDINTNLVVVYRPDVYNTTVFLEELNKLILAVVKDDKHTVVLGDFNQDILKSRDPFKLLWNRKASDNWCKDLQQMAIL